MLYELGIPVVETGETTAPQQRRAPLNAERDNVPAATFVTFGPSKFNHMHEHVTSEDTEEL